MDLSPGRRSDPATVRAGRTTSVESFLMPDSNIADAVIAEPQRTHRDGAKPQRMARAANQCATGDAAAACSLAKRSTQSFGSSCRNTRKAALVQPKPITFCWYPARILDSEERVTTSYFSRIVPSRRKFSAIVARKL